MHKKLLPLALIAGMATGCATMRNTGIDVATEKLPQDEQTFMRDYLKTGKLPDKLPESIQSALSQYQAGTVPASQLTQPVNTGSLPTKTESEKQILENQFKSASFVYTRGNSLIKETPSDGTLVDVSQPLKQRYGFISLPKGSGSEYVFFMKGNNLYRTAIADQKTDLVLPNVPLSDYVVSKDNVVFIEFVGEHPQTLGKVKADGSGLERMLTSNGDSLSSLAVSPDGTKATCTAVHRSPANPSKRKEHLLVDLATGKYTGIHFPHQYENNVASVAWFDNNNIMFVMNEGREKSDIYVAPIERIGAGKRKLKLTSKSILAYEVGEAKRLTTEHSPITSMSNTPSGLLYTAIEGNPVLKLKLGEKVLRISENFCGSNPYLLQNK